MIQIRNPFARKRIQPQQSPMYQYHQGDSSWLGAEVFAVSNTWGDPLVVIQGPGMIAGQLSPIQLPQVPVLNAQPVMPPQGTPFGAYALQGLIQESDLPDPNEPVMQ